MSYTLTTADGRFDVYAADGENVLGRMLGRPVWVRGKLIDLTADGGGEEIWIASIDTETADQGDG